MLIPGTKMLKTKLVIEYCASKGQIYIYSDINFVIKC